MASLLNVNDVKDLNGTDLLIIKQIVEVNNQTHYSGSSTSYTDLFSCSITPSSTSSKILIVAQLGISKENNHGALARLVKKIGSGSFSAFGGGATGDASRDANVWWNVRNTTYNVAPYTVPYLDSPSTTSEVTYKAQIRTTGSSEGWAVNQTINTSSNAYTSPIMSSIILFEVAA